MQITCKTCDQGQLILRKKYRMSGPVVLIGYILLVPSILGVIISIVSFVGVSSTPSNGGTDAAAVTGLVGGFTLLIGVAFFVSGLVGWLLVMKKKVLQCNVCGAAVNAA
jgi:hypothetical protein